jgi:hypothetical protein
VARHTPYRRTGDHDLADGCHLDEGGDGDRGSPAHTATNPGEVVHRYCPSSVGYTGYVIIFESLSSWCRPSRRRSKRILQRGASMGNRGPPAGSQCTRTVLSRHRKIDCSSFCSTSRPLRSRWCKGACLAWAKAKPISGFTSSCPHCWRRCAPSAMPRPAPSRPWRSGSASRRLTRRPSSHRWRRPHSWPQRQPLCRRPPFCP